MFEKEENGNTESGFYRHEPTGIVVGLFNDPELGTPLTNAYIKAGFTYVGTVDPRIAEAKEKAELEEKEKAEKAEREALEAKEKAELEARIKAEARAELEAELKANSPKTDTKVSEKVSK